ncbi:MAG: ABC transporter substrate-binding protein [Clostridiaceae bacterium]|nr:ABC transporter substrate-binding protein [Clostridiaceae bacterium]MBW4860230.1 ABC transporter substrate-binding protein [Clostridiaceae bacterium]MBW4869207.1 ABC transporter substrate-binding protein [Clostridiaceae bacterium]
MKRFLSLFLATIMIFGITGCQKNVKPSDAPTKAEETASKNTDEKSSHYPVTIQTHNYDGEPVEITFEKAPEKVLAVYQNSIETLLALGLGDKIIAASGLDHDVKDEYKEDFNKIKYYKERPTKEEVLGMKPDFILSWSSFFGEKHLGDVDFWHERGINTYMALNSGMLDEDSLEHEYQDILNIGKIFNVEDKANEIVDNMKAEIKKANDFAKDLEPVKTVILEVGSDNTYRIYGEDSIGGNIATQVGADLVAKENGTIGAEDLVKLNPEVIFTVYYGDEIDRDTALKEILENQGLSSISAIQNKRVHPIMLGEVYASGIRTLDGIKSISKGLYPELHED